MNRTAAATILLATTSPALGAMVSPTDPGLFVEGTVEEAFEARVRLDAGSGQSWKNALWQGGSLLDSGPNVVDVFTNSEAVTFTLRIDTGTGQVVFDVAGLGATTVLDLGENAAVAGYRLAARSERNKGAAELFDLIWTLDGEAAAGPGLASGNHDKWVDGSDFFFDRAVVVAELSGSVRFDWDSNANVRGERFKAMIFPLIGEARSPITQVPAPGSLALIGVGLLAGPARRRR